MKKTEKLEKENKSLKERNQLLEACIADMTKAVQNIGDLVKTGLKKSKQALFEESVPEDQL